MALNYSDLAVKSTDVMSADFFNRRFQLLVSEIQAAEAMASTYGTAASELVQRGLVQINGVLGSLLTQVQAAATLGFLVAPSTSNVTLTATVQANFVVAAANAPIFAPTSFLSVQDAGNAANWAIGQLQGWNSTTGALSIGILQTSTGNPISGSNWQIAASSAAFTSTQTAATNAATSATNAAASAASAAISAQDLALAVQSGPVLSVAGLTGAPTTAQLIAALGSLVKTNNLSDVSSAATALTNLGGLAKAANLSDVANAATALANLGVTFGTGAGNAVKLDGSARLPAVDGSQLINIAGVAPWAQDQELFGPGIDGDVTISAQTVTLTRDMYYNNLTVSGTGQLVTNGFVVYVASVLDISAAPANAIVPFMPASLVGASATASVPGAGTAYNLYGSGQTLPQNFAAGGPGAIASSTAGNTATAPSGSYIAGTVGAKGGSGGAGAAGAVGGVSATANASTSTTALLTRLAAQWREMIVAAANATYFNNGFPGAGGAGGGGDTTNAMGGCGGGGGDGGGIMAVLARTINRGASTPAGAINCNGGIGGSGAHGAASSTYYSGGSGGGGGGSGGLLYLVYRYLTGATAQGAVQANGGAGGNGGASGGGAATAGTGGQGGCGGVLRVYNLAAPTLTYIAPGTQNAAPSGVTGGAGGLSQMDL